MPRSKSPRSRRKKAEWSSPTPPSQGSQSSQAPEEIRALVERYSDNRADYEASGYKEAQVRREFIDPLFRALGWDIDNTAGFAEAYKDVVHEAALQIGGATKAPDYSFRVGGVRKFFVEAKKPSLNLKGDVSAAHQLRRYAWSAKLPLSVLTNFAEFAVYDCRVRPEPTGKAADARIEYLTFEDYLTHWHQIERVFGKQSIYKGSFDRFAADAKAKRGTAEVDDAFLAEIEGWRQSLAENIARRNRALALSRQDFNYGVQATIDRIIFLRICEDRGLEGYGALRSAVAGKNVYQSLLELFWKADTRYNSGLFHFRHEKGHAEDPDELTPRLVIDDSILKGIIGGLYYPKSPYEFSVISADILGRAYEQYLGKTIVLRGARVTVDEKPEVRKAGGVYYTPSFVVDYIARVALTPLLSGKTVKQAAALRVLDPACGSGSFLISAYQFLLDWHLDQYLSMKRRPRVVFRTPDGSWRLSLNERKRILLNNIFGVDIDPQAVEIAKLSLLLKVIEGETQMALATNRLLPDLGRNVVCGNSLIGTDYYEGGMLPGFYDDQNGQVNAFDWPSSFPKVFADGGFDAVIGNPPYLSVDDTWGKKDPRLAYLKRAYGQVYNDKSDVLFYFLAKAVEVSREEVCFIVSRAFLEAYKADKLREFIGESAQVREIVDLQNAQVFEGVGITTAIVHLTKRKVTAKANFRRLRADRLPAGATASTLAKPELFDTVKVRQDLFRREPWIFVRDSLRVILDQVDQAGEPLGQVLHLGQGMQTGKNTVFGNRTAAEVQEWRMPAELVFQRARNSDIQRYVIRDRGEFLVYTEAVSSFSSLPTGVQAHLMAHRAELEDRAAFKRGDCEWWRWTWPLHKEYLGRGMLYCPYLATENRFALDADSRFIGLTDTTVLYDKGQPEDLRYLLGLLNSRLLTARFRYIGKLKSGGILEYFWNSLSKLPIRRIDPGDDRHDRMVELVQAMIDSHVTLAEARSPTEKVVVRRRISALDEQIERLVRDLYGISAESMAKLDRELGRGSFQVDDEPVDPGSPAVTEEL